MRRPPIFNSGMSPNPYCDINCVRRFWYLESAESWLASRDRYEDRRYFEAEIVGTIADVSVPFLCDIALLFVTCHVSEESLMQK